MKETKVDYGQESPRRVPDGTPAEIENERASPIRWITVTSEAPSRLRGALRQDGDGPYLLCGCGQVLRRGDRLLAAGERFYCPDCAGLWLAANLSPFEGLSP